jgi:transcriptional regulator with XRE-family HTH domain
MLCNTMSDESVTVIRGWRPELRFSDRLRMVRLQYGKMLERRLDQRQIAELVGLPRGSWASWENGTSEPRHAVRVVEQISRVTGVNAAWLLGLDRFDPNPAPNIPVGVSNSSPSTG